MPGRSLQQVLLQLATSMAAFSAKLTRQLRRDISSFGRWVAVQAARAARFSARLGRELVRVLDLWVRVAWRVMRSLWDGLVALVRRTLRWSVRVARWLYNVVVRIEARLSELLAGFVQWAWAMRLAAVLVGIDVGLVWWALSVPWLWFAVVLWTTLVGGLVARAILVGPEAGSADEGPWSTDFPRTRLVMLWVMRALFLYLSVTQFTPFLWVHLEPYLSAGVDTLGRLRTGGSDAGGLSKALPARIEGVCPGEGGCMFAHWIVEQETSVFDEPGGAAVAILSPGDRVFGVTSMIVTEQPGRVRAVTADRAIQFGDVSSVSLGEEFDTYYYAGEGCWAISRGPTFPVLCAAVDVLSEPRLRWWVKVQTSRGRIVWSDSPSSFCGVTRYDECTESAAASTTTATSQPSRTPTTTTAQTATGTILAVVAPSPTVADSASAATASPAVGANVVPASLARQIVADVDGQMWLRDMYSGSIDKLASALASKRVDLNDDGRGEYLVTACDSAMCGSGGCALWIYGQTESGFFSLFGDQSSRGSELLVGCMNTVAVATSPGKYGYRTIRLAGQVTLTFDGRRYRVEPAAQ